MTLRRECVSACPTVRQFTIPSSALADSTPVLRGPDGEIRERKGKRKKKSGSTTSDERTGKLLFRVMGPSLLFLPGWNVDADEKRGGWLMTVSRDEYLTL